MLLTQVSSRGTTSARPNHDGDRLVDVDLGHAHPDAGATERAAIEIGPVERELRKHATRDLEPGLAPCLCDGGNVRALARTNVVDFTVTIVILSVADLF